MNGSTRAYEFGRRLAGRGHEVHMFCGTPADQPHPSAREVARESGIVVHWLPVAYGATMGYRRRLRAFGGYAWRAALAAERLAPDLVFATSTPLTVAVPAHYAARRHRAPMVMEVRDLWPEAPIALGALRSPVSRWTAWRLEAWAYRGAAHVIALSHSMADDIRRRFPTVPVTVVPNGSDIALFGDADDAGRRLRATTGWLGDRPLILYAGALGIVNEVEYLVRMAADLHRTDPDIRVAVLGSGNRADAVRTLARQLGVLGRNLFLLGPRPKTDVVAYLGACDLALSCAREHPALRNDAVNKVFDALAAGRPVGLNHGGSLTDVVVRAGAGLALSPGDPGRAAVAVASFLRDRDARRRARAAAAALARDRFDRDMLFTDFERVLLAAAGQGAPPCQLTAPERP